MERVELKTQKRKETGKKFAKNLRKQGMIPAVVYRAGEESLSISISQRELIHALHTSAGENVIIDLQISGADKKKHTKTVIIKEIQYHPIKTDVLHVDFNEISLTETIEVKVPIETKGEAIGVKRDDGVLEHMLWELEIECLPTKIPEKIEVSVENMEIGHAIHVKDLVIPEGIKVLDDPEAVVITVEPPKAEEVVEAAPEEEITEPELIRKKKEVEEEEGETKEQPQEQERSKESKEK